MDADDSPTLNKTKRPNPWALHEAVQRGDTAALRALLLALDGLAAPSHDEDVEDVDREEDDTLTWLSPTEVLGRMDEAGLAPFHWAARLRRPKALTLLATAIIRHHGTDGAYPSQQKDVDDQEEDDDDKWAENLLLNQANEEGTTALQDLIALAAADGEHTVPHGDGADKEEEDVGSALTCVGALLTAAKEAEEKKRKGPRGRRRGAAEVMVADVVDACTGASPLSDCVANDCPQLARLLVTHGADPHVVNPEGETLLFPAVASGDAELVSLLLECGVNLCRQNLQGLTVFHVAACSNHPHLITLLAAGLPQGGRQQVLAVVQAVSEAGMTARMEAEWLGHQHCARLLHQLEKEKEKESASDQLSKLSPSLLLAIARHLDHPRDLIHLAMTCSLFHRLYNINDKEDQIHPWKWMLEKWYGADEVKAASNKSGRLWSAVYGMGRPIYAVRVFYDYYSSSSSASFWQQCFRERSLVARADPFTMRGVDRLLHLHFVSAVSASASSASAAEVLKSSILFPMASFEYTLYGGTLLVAGHSREQVVVVVPTPYKRSPSAPVVGEDGLADLCLVCFPVVIGDGEHTFTSPLTMPTLLHFTGGRAKSCPVVLVGVRLPSSPVEEDIHASKDWIPLADALTALQQSCPEATDYVECQVGSDGSSRGLSALFEHVVGRLPPQHH